MRTILDKSTKYYYKGNLSIADIQKWFDELFPEIKQEEEISDEKVLTLLDKIFVLIGSIGVFATFMTSVYFIAKHLLLK